MHFYAIPTLYLINFTLSIFPSHHFPLFLLIFNNNKLYFTLGHLVCCTHTVIVTHSSSNSNTNTKLRKVRQCLCANGSNYMKFNSKFLGMGGLNNSLGSTILGSMVNCGFFGIVSLLLAKNKSMLKLI